jgi:hypothetical protein
VGALARAGTTDGAVARQPAARPLPVRPALVRVRVRGGSQSARAALIGLRVRAEDDRKGPGVSEPGHIRPEIKWEVDSFIQLRSQLHKAQAELEMTFTARMAMQKLSPGEDAMVQEALYRAD